MTKALFGVAVCVLLCQSVWAANFSGKWQVGKSSLVLNQVGNRVDGIFASDDPMGISGVKGEIHDAKVEGDTLTFYVWLGSDKPVKQSYRGILIDDMIHFTIIGGLLPVTDAPIPTRSSKTVEVDAVRTR